MIAFLTKWWPSILAAITALWATFGVQIQTAVASHPKLSTFIAAAVVVLSHLLPSPVAASQGAKTTP
jgi:hypothetical protein